MKGNPFDEEEVSRFKYDDRVAAPDYHGPERPTHHVTVLLPRIAKSTVSCDNKLVVSVVVGLTIVRRSPERRKFVFGECGVRRRDDESSSWRGGCRARWWRGRWSVERKDGGDERGCTATGESNSLGESVSRSPTANDGRPNSR